MSALATATNTITKIAESMAMVDLALLIIQG